MHLENELPRKYSGSLGCNTVIRRGATDMKVMLSFQMLITNSQTAKPLRMEMPQSFETSGTTCPPTQHHTTMRTWNLIN